MESWLSPSEWRPASIPGAFPKPPSSCQMHAEGSTGPWQFHTRVYQQRHRFYTAVGQLLQFSEPLYLPIKQIKPISQGCNKVKMQLTCNVPTMISRHCRHSTNSDLLNWYGKWGEALLGQILSNSFFGQIKYFSTFMSTPGSGNASKRSSSCKGDSAVNDSLPV